MQFESRLLKLIAAIGCVLLGPILVLAGLAGYFDLACSGDDQGLSWAVLLVILIPLMFPVQVAVLWTAVALALIFAVRPTANRHRLTISTIVSLASVPITFAAGLLWAWTTHASVSCVLGAF
jgi:hypothetical protein